MTDEDRRQRAKQYWLPTLCVGGPVITVVLCAAYNYTNRLVQGSAVRK